MKTLTITKIHPRQGQFVKDVGAVVTVECRFSDDLNDDTIAECFDFPWKNVGGSSVHSRLSKKTFINVPESEIKRTKEMPKVGDVFRYKGEPEWRKA